MRGKATNFQFISRLRHKFMQGQVNDCTVVNDSRVTAICHHPLSNALPCSEKIFNGKDDYFESSFKIVLDRLIHEYETIYFYIENKMAKLVCEDSE